MAARGRPPLRLWRLPPLGRPIPAAHEERQAQSSKERKGGGGEGDAACGRAQAGAGAHLAAVGARVRPLSGASGHVGAELIPSEDETGLGLRGDGHLRRRGAVGSHPARKVWARERPRVNAHTVGGMEPGAEGQG